MNIVKIVIILCVSLFVGGCIVKALQLEGVARMATYLYVA